MTKAEYQIKLLAIMQDDKLGITNKLLMASDVKDARIAELEKAAIVWHRYPEEKPTKKDLYVVYLSSRNLAREDLWDNDKQRWDHTPEDCQHLITHWAYLPATPEEEK